RPVPGSEVSCVPYFGRRTPGTDAIEAAISRRELPLLIVLLVAASPLLHTRSIGGPKSGCVHTVIAVLVDDVVPGHGIVAVVGQVYVNIFDQQCRRIRLLSVG